MRRRTVTFTPQARSDLFSIGDWIAERAGMDVALSYVERLEAYCNGFELQASEGDGGTICARACVLSASDGEWRSCLPSQTTK